MNERSRIQGWHPESEFRNLLEDIKRIIENPSVERNLLMTIQADVQKLIDEVAQNKDFVKSMINGQQIQGKQITDLQAQIAGLQAGQVLTVDDLNAIKTAVTDLGDTNTALQTAVPGNTPGQPTIPPTGPLDANGNPIP